MSKTLMKHIDYTIQRENCTVKLDLVQMSTTLHNGINKLLFNMHAVFSVGKILLMDAILKQGYI